MGYSPYTCFDCGGGYFRCGNKDECQNDMHACSIWVNIDDKLSAEEKIERRKEIAEENAEWATRSDGSPCKVRPDRCEECDEPIYVCDGEQGCWEHEAVVVINGKAYTGWYDGYERVVCLDEGQSIKGYVCVECISDLRFSFEQDRRQWRKDVGWDKKLDQMPKECQSYQYRKKTTICSRMVFCRSCFLSLNYQVLYPFDVEVDGKAALDDPVETIDSNSNKEDYTRSN